MAAESAMPNKVTDQRPTLVFDTDVLVVGGGAAGLAAAVTAARTGLRVILVERGKSRAAA
jgi:succinate dehydrogenase/fumarate reductase flavoprotein subunit